MLWFCDTHRGDEGVKECVVFLGSHVYQKGKCPYKEHNYMPCIRGEGLGCVGRGEGYVGRAHGGGTVY